MTLRLSVLLGTLHRVSANLPKASLRVKFLLKNPQRLPITMGSVDYDIYLVICKPKSTFEYVR